MRPVRIGAVAYLNARPLTWTLDRAPARWHVRYDLPSVCAELLHANEVDLGLIPSVEYLQATDYRLVPGVGIGSRGPIASVALFTRKPIREIRTIALDTSSRTSVALVRVLCARRFHVFPEFMRHAPELATMTETCDAALLIGDPALDANHEALGLHKIDLGEEWTAMTGLPFIYAAWTGRPGVLTADDVAALQAAQADGVSSLDAVAEEYGCGDRSVVARAAAYLRDNVRYGLGDEEAAGLQLFLNYAAEMGIGPAGRILEFY